LNQGLWCESCDEYISNCDVCTAGPNTEYDINKDYSYTQDACEFCFAGEDNGQSDHYYFPQAENIEIFDACDIHIQDCASLDANGIC